MHIYIIYMHYSIYKISRQQDILTRYWAIYLLLVYTNNFTKDMTLKQWKIKMSSVYHKKPRQIFHPKFDIQTKK